MSGVLLVVVEQPGHERLALARASIGEERFQLVWRRQETPDVEIDASRKLRVRDHSRFRHAAIGQVSRDEPIERPRPVFPDRRGNCGPRQRQRRFPGVGRRLRCRRLPGTLIDPRANYGDFAVGQRLFVLRHLRLDFSGQPMDHQAVGAVPGPDDGAVATAVERIRIRREGEPALSLVLAMAFQTPLRQDRLHLTLVVDKRRAEPATAACRPHPLSCAHRTPRTAQPRLERRTFRTPSPESRAPSPGSLALP